MCVCVCVYSILVFVLINMSTFKEMFITIFLFEVGDCLLTFSISRLLRFVCNGLILFSKNDLCIFKTVKHRTDHDSFFFSSLFLFSLYLFDFSLHCSMKMK